MYKRQANPVHSFEFSISSVRWWTFFVQLNTDNVEKAQTCCLGIPLICTLYNKNNHLMG